MKIAIQMLKDKVDHIEFIRIRLNSIDINKINVEEEDAIKETLSLLTDLKNIYGYEISELLKAEEILRGNKINVCEDSHEN